MPQGERLVKLKQIAIQQMQVLEDIDIAAMGFPRGWENEPLWK